MKIGVGRTDQRDILRVFRNRQRRPGLDHRRSGVHVRHCHRNIEVARERRGGVAVGDPNRHIVNVVPAVVGRELKIGRRVEGQQPRGRVDGEQGRIQPTHNRVTERGELNRPIGVGRLHGGHRGGSLVHRRCQIKVRLRWIVIHRSDGDGLEGVDLHPAGSRGDPHQVVVVAPRVGRVLIVGGHIERQLARCGVDREVCGIGPTGQRPGDPGVVRVFGRVSPDHLRAFRYAGTRQDPEDGRIIHRGHRDRASPGVRSPPVTIRHDEGKRAGQFRWRVANVGEADLPQHGSRRLRGRQGTIEADDQGARARTARARPDDRRSVQHV